MSKFRLITHNPECHIVENRISLGASINYVIYVNGPKAGQEACEYYSGQNYFPDSPNKKSYSRHWKDIQDVPKAHRTALEEARAYYMDVMAESVHYIK
jgi:hypothetical protein